MDNLCSIYVFSQKKLQKRKLNNYLLILAVFELIFCTILFSDYMFRTVYIKPMFLHDLNIYTSMFFDFSIHFIDSFESVLTLILSVDRLLAMKNRSGAKHLVTNVHAKFLTMSTFFLLLVLKTPGFFLCYRNSNKMFNIIYCTLVSPLILNIIPTIVILIINLILVSKVVKYFRNHTTSPRLSWLSTRHTSAASNSCVSHSKRKAQVYLSIFSRRYSRRQFGQLQKSHFIVIIAIALWSVLTKVPYYSLNTFYLLFSLNIFEHKIDFKTSHIVQVSTSIFFNSNHCSNFFINLFFNIEFRKYIGKLVNQAFLKLRRIQPNFTSNSFE